MNSLTGSSRPFQLYCKQQTAPASALTLPGHGRQTRAKEIVSVKKSTTIIPKTRAERTPRHDGISPAERARILELHKSGAIPTSIGRSIGRPPTTVFRALARLNIEPNRTANLTQTILRRAIRLYEEGATLRAIAIALEVSTHPVRAALRSAGIVRRSSGAHWKGKRSTRRCLSDEQEIEACSLYQKGLSQRAIANRFNVSPTAIGGIRKRRGISTEPRRYVPTKSGKRFRFVRRTGIAIFLRSSYEAAFAGYLDAKNIDWEYEPQEFLLSNGRTYTPDFYIREWEMLVEIKGYLWKDAGEKIDLFRLDYPDKHLVVVNKPALFLYGIKADKKGHAWFCN